MADHYGRASHALLTLGTESLINMEHRGALNADARTGDGAGVLTPLPRRLLAREAERLTGQPVDPDQLGVGVFFLPARHRAAACSLGRGRVRPAAHHAAGVGGPVPIAPEVLGGQARASMPACGTPSSPPASRPRARRSIRAPAVPGPQTLRARGARRCGAYVPSLFDAAPSFTKACCWPRSCPPSTRPARPRLTSAAGGLPPALQHQHRPTWQNAQPFRMLCHNGEINTLQGNLAWMQAREPLLAAGFADGAGRLRPVIDTDGSDSAMLDNVVELLVHGGRDMRHALTMLVPPAWEKHARPARDRARLLRLPRRPHRAVGRPGRAGLHRRPTVGATLDRNGLRPCRYLVTEDGLVAAASEAGAVPRRSGAASSCRAGSAPARCLRSTPPPAGCIDDAAIKHELAARQPYGAWLRRMRRQPAQRRCPPRPRRSRCDARSVAAQSPLQAAFGYTSEELVDGAAADGRERGRGRSARWATTRRWRCSRTSRARCSATSGSASPRSPTRPSTRCARSW